jgi:Mg2+/Co2+ transporter CorB
MDQGTWVMISGIVVLIVISALFSGSETALTAVSEARMLHLERMGNRRAALVRRLVANKESLIGAILLGNNLVNILAAALATSMLIGLYGEAGVVYATLGMTLVILVFAEIMPKTFAFNHPDRTALAVAPALDVIIRLFAPPVVAIQFFVRRVIRLFGGAPPTGISEEAREEELRGAIELHRGEDQEIRDERRMLRSVLDLGDVPVEDIMVHRSNMLTINVDLSTKETVEHALASPYTRIPLWQDEPENIIGVLHAKDLLRAINTESGDIDGIEIRAVATTPWFVPETTTLLDQLRAFRRRREHFALVVDEYGVLMGLVTLEDILEEIVGEISDEHDIIVPGVRAQPDGSLICAGDVTIRDLNREFEWTLPDDEAATIAGLILREARQIPDVDQVFDFFGFRFRILRRKRNQITSIRITPPRPRPTGDA